jgi:ATP-binding cassette subfamily B protein
MMGVPSMAESSTAEERAVAFEKLMEAVRKLPREQLDKMMTKSDGTMKFDTSEKNTAGVADYIRKTNGKVDFKAFGTVLLKLLALYLLSAAFGFAMQYLMSSVSQRTTYVLRRDVNEKLSRLPLKFFDSRTHGEILSRMTNDIDTISQTLQQNLTTAITSIVQLIGYVVMMLTISPALTGIVLATLPLYVVATMFTAKKSQKFFASQQ